MNLLKYILLLLIFLGFFSVNLKAEVIIKENKQLKSFSEQSFKEQRKQTKWLGLLYLQEESTNQNQASFFNVSSISLDQNFSREVCLKSKIPFNQKTTFLNGNGPKTDLIWVISEIEVVQEILRKTVGLDLVDAWKKFGDSPLRTNTKFLEHINDLSASWKITHNGGVTKILDSNGKELAELSEGLVKTKGETKANGDWNKLLNKPPMKNQK